MSCEVIVIAEGYSRTVNDDVMHANCSCVLIKDTGVNVIVDTMTAWDARTIIDGLKKADVRPEDITYVINTHGHSDHCGNNNLFLNENVEHITGNSISYSDVYHFHDFKTSNYYISPNVHVRSTPGHTTECVSVVVKYTTLGTVIISGDLFEREEDITDSSIWILAGSQNEQLQRKNRHLISLEADYIIPGHGPMFKVTDEHRNELAKQLADNS